jgi:hypothetical protein
MRRSALSKIAAKMGRKGGRNAAKKLRASKTREQITETMRAVANARWTAVRAAAKQAELLEAS